MVRPDLLSQRLNNQHLTGSLLEKPEDVVQWLGAVQSQDYLGAKWSVGQRVRQGTDAAVERAFASGKILRTHVLRPTWHFVAPKDIRWMLQLTAPRVHALNAYYYRKFELDDALLARAHTVLTKALRGGKERTRTELAALLEQAGIVADGLRLGYIMMHAELEARVCSGAPRGKQQTYALLEERVPEAKAFAPDEALAELTRRFFTGHAPATLKHYVWWSGLSVAAAKAGLAMVQQQLTREVRGGTEWFGVSRPAARRVKTAAYLVPEYDEALVGSRDMDVPDMPRPKHLAPWKDVYYRPVLIDGMRAGTWKRTITKGEAVLETNLFASLNAEHSKALKAAADRYGRFLEMPVILV